MTRVPQFPQPHKMNDTISNLQIVSCTKSNLESPHRTQTRKSIEIAQMLNTRWPFIFTTHRLSAELPSKVPRSVRQCSQRPESWSWDGARGAAACNVLCRCRVCAPQRVYGEHCDICTLTLTKHRHTQSNSTSSHYIEATC